MYTPMGSQRAASPANLSKVQKSVLGQAAQVMITDVSQYLPPDDAPIASVEDIVALPKYTTEASTRYLRGFRPPRNVDIPVRTEENHLLNMTGYMNTIGYVYLDLQLSNEFLRKFHTHPDHHDPDGNIVDCPHMHFPSRKYPLAEKGQSYAYPLDDVDDDIGDIIEAVEIFSAELDVSLETWQPYLPGGDA